jgi:Fe-S oxidoreductase
MCPSFQVTREEEHSTRGRARLIGEMLSGDLADEGWRSEALRDALDLCLGCKACRVECPVGVDMATYRVEFLAHHYRHRVRPRSHYAFGYLPVALRVASFAPRMVNALLTQPSIGRWLRRFSGVAEGAALPKIGRRSATPATPRRRGKERGDRVRFADCFTRFIDPEASEAADEVLGALGLACDVVGGATCCGLTWYSTGQLGIARRVLGHTVKTLRRAGSGQIVVLEPSCAAMLRDEAASLLGEDVADVSSRIVTLAEVIEPLGLEGRGVIEEPVVAQIHCHAYAGAAYRSELECVVALGGDLAAVETACCGLAGNFGLESGHEKVAIAIAERHIVKTLSGAPSNALIMADGFSCRTQIAAVAGRESRHFAVIVRNALRRGGVPLPPTSEP